ncbi:hypothetical protein [Streptomyces sp. NPDC052012]|uniref:hypothetical protein n=1 Tax=Streptomyces sp. NPDC052012 TaxID=3155051 RepID=UPI00344B0553
MSESPASVTDLTSQYTAQVASDLERNVKEQERVSAEIAALQERLAALQRDHTVLVNMQQALGVAAQPPAAAETAGSAEPPASDGTSGPEAVSRGATVPAPRRRSGGAKSGADKPKRGKRSTAASPRATSGKPARTSSRSKGATRSEAATGPKLVELVRRHLAEQKEPRSAAEIATAIGRSHPERSVKTTVVRSTLEGLVARNQAQRSKQGSSVFYTAPDTDPEDTAKTSETSSPS